MKLTKDFYVLVSDREIDIIHKDKFEAKIEMFNRVHATFNETYELFGPFATLHHAEDFIKEVE